MSGTSHFNYTPIKNSKPLSFQDNFQGRYDVATKKLIFVFQPIMVFESLPEKKADSIYYSYSVTEVGDSLVMTLEADNKKTTDYTYQAATGSWVIYPLPTLMRISYMKPVTALKYKESDSVAAFKPKDIIPVSVREKEIQHTIMLDTSFISIDLYDNGEIDNDSITLLLNGKTVVQNKQLSLKSVSLSLELNKEPAEHILEMFADNLGSIPPNTALLVLTCKQKRYELNLSSNGKVNGSVKLIVRPRL